VVDGRLRIFGWSVLDTLLKCFARTRLCGYGNLSNAVLFYCTFFFGDDTTNEWRGDGMECMGGKAGNEASKMVYGWFVDCLLLK
jgi:hypothetical protein